MTNFPCVAFTEYACDVIKWNKMSTWFISQLIPIRNQQLVFLIIIANGRAFHTPNAAGRTELSFPKSSRHASMNILAGISQKQHLLKIAKWVLTFLINANVCVLFQAYMERRVLISYRLKEYLVGYAF